MSNFLPDLPSDASSEDADVHRPLEPDPPGDPHGQAFDHEGIRIRGQRIRKPKHTAPVKPKVRPPQAQPSNPPPDTASDPPTAPMAPIPGAEEPIFQPTYAGGRLERTWIVDSLADFYFDQLIGDVLFKVKGGKEANVYACTSVEDPDRLLAAKIYRPEAFRAMKNDGVYRMGREEVNADGKAMRDNRAQRAMAKRTAKGRAMRSASWIHHEYDALEDCFEAGVPVPEPIALNERCILMAFIGDRQAAAPMLSDTHLDPEVAPRVFDRLLEGIEIMLEGRRIHGDLSPYNVLWDGTEPWIIDLPQTVDPTRHPQARELLTRDVARLTDYFARLDDDRDTETIVDYLWQTVVALE